MPVHVDLFVVSVFCLTPHSFFAGEYPYRRHRKRGAVHACCLSLFILWKRLGGQAMFWPLLPTSVYFLNAREIQPRDFIPTADGHFTPRLHPADGLLLKGRRYRHSADQKFFNKSLTPLPCVCVRVCVSHRSSCVSFAPHRWPYDLHIVRNDSVLVYIVR